VSVKYTHPVVIRLPTTLCMAIVLLGCAPKNKADPLEPFNRGMSAVNKKLDTFVIRPVALAYDKSIPPPVKKGVTNFFDNLWTIPTIANDLLQFQFRQAGIATMRFAFNTTFGIGGLFDIASKSKKLPAHKQDFGHTLERWGYKKSMYLVLPIFGPSTIRDGIGRILNLYLTPYPYISSVATRNWLLGINFVSDRADFLPLETLISSAAVDEYVFIRDAYLQKRESDLAQGAYTIGKDSGIAETTFTGGKEVPVPSTSGGALEHLEGPPE
jgi:phospholipid-binding lipoprotein MlaA